MWKLLFYVALVVGAIAFGSTYSGRLELLAQAAALVVGAFGYIGVFGLMHESAHGHLARTGRLNRIFGEALSVVVGTSYPGYRTAHLTHHARFRSDRDPQEVIHPRRPKPIMAALLIVATVIGAPVFLLVKAPLIAAKRGNVIRAIWGPLASITLYVSLGLLLPDPQATFLILTIVAAYVLGSMNDIVYHQGLVDDDSLQASTSFDCDVFGQAFLSGANRHAEHHLYPNIPGPRLVKASKELRGQLQEAGVPFERAFSIAFVKRLTVNPVFLPPPGPDELAETSK